jgi:hypothetical protein
MSTFHRRLCLVSTGIILAAAPALRSAEPVNPADVKRVTDRYALTHARINALVDQRLHPAPLPANPPNPFYQPPKEAAGDAPATEKPETALVPETADISDIDTLRKYAGTLKIGGVINRNGSFFLSLNNTPCKVGDVIPVGNKERPTYLKLVSLSAFEFTLGLNDATLVVSLKK